MWGESVQAATQAQSRTIARLCRLQAIRALVHRAQHRLRRAGCTFSDGHALGFEDTQKPAKGVGILKLWCGRKYKELPKVARDVFDTLTNRLLKSLNLIDYQ